MGTLRMSFKLPRGENSGYSGMQFNAWETTMTWWGWMVLGAVLLGAELFAIDAQFYLVFLGLSAALVGLGSLLGIEMAEWVQLLRVMVLMISATGERPSTRITSPGRISYLRRSKSERGILTS